MYTTLLFIHTRFTRNLAHITPINSISRLQAPTTEQATSIRPYDAITPFTVCCEDPASSDPPYNATSERSSSCI